MISRCTFLVTACALLIAGCSRDTPTDAPATAAAPESEAPTNRIDIPPAVRSNLGITFARVERRIVEGTIRMPGAFEVRPLARHEYRLKLPGRVSIEVDQYDQVEPGDVLYRFLSPEWPEIQHEIVVGEQDIESAQASIDVARARIEEAERQLAILRDRIAELERAEFRRADLEAEVGTVEASLPRLRAELRQAETNLANAHRTREHALHRASAATGIPESRLAEEIAHQGERIPVYRTIDWVSVYATEPGVVESLALTDGAFADAPSLVLSTIDPTKVRFRALALQADLDRLQRRTGARIVPASEGEGVDATVTIGLEAHPEQRTVALLAIPSEPQSWMRPGVSAFLEVVVATTGGPTLAIPRTAIVRDGIVHVFFRRDPQDPDKVIRVEADMGATDGRWVSIRSGLMLSDEVVLAGAYELKLASQQSGVAQRGGHFHADGSFHNED